MLIASFETFGLVTHFDPTTGGTEHVRSLEPSQAAHGHYGKLAGTDVVFYRDTGGLLLRVSEETVRLDGSADVEHHVVGSDCVLSIARRIKLGDTVPSEWSGLKDDPTPFVEAEDFYLGLFVSNVVRDPERSAQIYR
ncbi:hypothetical protein [Kitasatospora sp. MBT66]|uniref:hypothetical protein n=1 Tax=Kitasatospora sp. MBT66 TaxID=1444769 RepID=UPI0005BCE7F6|nr:hypothetical protein [Kitasatospora sp. MBT66]